MSIEVSIINNKASNPATLPTLPEELRQSILRKTEKTSLFLKQAVVEFPNVTFANSLGAEDMVLTDIISRGSLPIEIFSLDTGRLPKETYDLITEAESHYQKKFKIYFPNFEKVEDYVNTNGINAFYQSTDLRKACCFIRKVEPLTRALASKQAWITGMRAEQSKTRSDLPFREYDSSNKLEKLNPLSDWTEKEIWGYIRIHSVPYNKLHDEFYPSIGCAPCTRAIAMGEDIRAGRWWWEDENGKECGLHVKQNLNP